MNAQRFVMLTLMLTLSLVCLHSPASLYPENTFNFKTLPTTSTLDATHLVVGEITHVSFVFEIVFSEGPEYSSSGPLSIATLRIDWDMKETIDRAENPNEPRSVNETDTVSFVQVGGPLPDGDVVYASGYRLLKEGDYVFLKLVRSNYPVTNQGVTVHASTREHGTMYDVKKKGKDNVGKHIITRGWNKLDVTVLDMNRIVRSTLKKTEAMRSLDEEMNSLHHLGDQARLQMLMDKVEEIERELELPELNIEENRSDALTR